MAGLKEIQQAFVNPNEIALTEANFILDNFNDSLGASVSYMMDQEGKTIASSNRNDRDSFVGKNYSFRPYFQKAIRGNPSIYMALGVTSKKRGLYYSYPVYERTEKNPIGVVILKTSAEATEKELLSSLYRAPGMFKLIIGPHGVVFMSDHKKFLYRLLWKVTDEERIKISKSKQFGKGPWEWAGFERRGRGRVVDKSGYEYLMFQKKIESLPGWNIVHLSNLETISERVSTPFVKIVGYLTLILCALIGLSVFILYRLAKSDITNRSKAEEALNASQQRLSQIINLLPDATMVIDLEGKVIAWNRAIEHITGIKAQEMLGKGNYEYAIPFYGERRPVLIDLVGQWNKEIEEKYQYVKKEGESLVSETYDSLVKPGGFLWNKASLLYDRTGEVMGAIESIRDISERKKSEEALRESEDKYRTLVEESFDGIFIQRGPSIIFVNKRLNEMLGYGKGELIGQNHWVVYHPEYQKLTRERAQARMRGEEVVRRYEVKLQRKDGSWFYGEINARPITFLSDEESGVQVWIKDIMEQKLAEETLQASEEKYRLLIENATDAIFIAQDEILKFANPKAEEMTGYSAEELAKSPFLDLIHPDDRDMVLERHLNRLKGEKIASMYSFRILNRSGKELSVELNAVLINWEGRPATLNFLRDITSQKQLQSQLQQAQKMEAIGMLAGGVAHDLNNILGGLVSYPELLLLQLPEDSPLRKSILTIQKSGEKAAAVVQDLLTLARRGVVVTEVVNLNKVIAEYLKSPELEKLQSYHPGVHIETHLENVILNILGSPTHLSKTVMNLVSNAAEAMREGGTLSISTENRHIDRPIRGYNEVMEGDYVVLTICDTGTGIASDDLEKIFEPFYTKKKMGRSGTGLGMAVVWGTVKDHNGYIDVQSTEGKGTTFTLYFPVTRERLPENESHLAIESYSGNGESILVIDDVEEQRKIASGMLEELGYSVVSVSSGEEAVEYLTTNKIDLLILDMIMDPGMDGLDTYKKILEIHPEQKAIIASGFSETDRAKELQNLGAGAYIKKPFLLEKIGIAVKEELEK